MYDKGTFIGKEKPSDARTTAVIATANSIFAPITSVVTVTVTPSAQVDKTLVDGRAQRKADLCI